MPTLTNANIIKGSALMLFFDQREAGASAPDYQAVGFATEHSIEINLETVDISTKDHGDFAAVLPQRLTWSGSASNLYSDLGVEAYYKAINSMSPIKVKFAKAQYTPTGATGPHDYEPYADTGGAAEKGIVNAANGATSWAPGDVIAEGEALVTNVSINASAGDNGTLSIQLQGVGALTSDFDNE